MDGVFTNYLKNKNIASCVSGSDLRQRVSPADNVNNTCIGITVTWGYDLRASQIHPFQASDRRVCCMDHGFLQIQRSCDIRQLKIDLI